MSGTYAPSLVGPADGRQVWQLVDLFEPFDSYDRVVRGAGGAPMYWAEFDDAAEAADATGATPER